MRQSCACGGRIHPLEVRPLDRHVAHFRCDTCGKTFRQGRRGSSQPRSFMRTFPHFNPSSDSLCPICGTNDDEETVLIPIAGTQDGNNCQAVQVHTKCLQMKWFYHPTQNFIGVPCLAKDP